MADSGRMLAISDLHVGFDENRDLVSQLRLPSADGWLLVAGDVGEKIGGNARALTTLADRFARVVWVPGDHELWSRRGDPPRLRGERRYHYLVELCRDIGVVTPEDPYITWHGQGGPVAIVPLFLLHDYSFGRPESKAKKEALDAAYEDGVVCSDEFLLDPDPSATREEWCDARVTLTQVYGHLPLPGTSRHDGPGWKRCHSGIRWSGFSMGDRWGCR